jgi:hypothetical protein
MIIVLIVTVYGGYLFPLAGAILSWREWLVNKGDLPRTVWRRTVALIALLFLTAEIPLWVYAAVHELRNDYSYIFTSAVIGRWSSLVLLALAAVAEDRVRRYLLLGALGLLFFYGASIGELP